MNDFLQSLFNVPVTGFFHQPFKLNSGFYIEFEKRFEETFSLVQSGTASDSDFYNLGKMLQTDLLVNFLRGSFYRLLLSFNRLQKVSKCLTVAQSEIITMQLTRTTNILFKSLLLAIKKTSVDFIGFANRCERTFMISEFKIFDFTPGDSYSATTDGTFIYEIAASPNLIHLSKIGTGRNGTQIGIVYKKVHLPLSNKKLISIVYLDQKLYIKHNQEQAGLIDMHCPNSLTKIDSISLNIKEYMKNPHVSQYNKTFKIFTDGKQLYTLLIAHKVVKVEKAKEETKVAENDKKPVPVPDKKEVPDSLIKDEERFKGFFQKGIDDKFFDKIGLNGKEEKFDFYKKLEQLELQKAIKLSKESKDKMEAKISAEPLPKIETKEPEKKLLKNSLEDASSIFKSLNFFGNFAPTRHHENDQIDDEATLEERILLKPSGMRTLEERMEFLTLQKNKLIKSIEKRIETEKQDDDNDSAIDASEMDSDQQLNDAHKDAYSIKQALNNELRKKKSTKNIFGSFNSYVPNHRQEINEKISFVDEEEANLEKMYLEARQKMETEEKNKELNKKIMQAIETDLELLKREKILNEFDFNESGLKHPNRHRNFTGGEKSLTSATPAFGRPYGGMRKDPGESFFRKDTNDYENDLFYEEYFQNFAPGKIHDQSYIEKMAEIEMIKRSRDLYKNKSKPTNEKACVKPAQAVISQDGEKNIIEFYVLRFSLEKKEAQEQEVLSENQNRDELATELCEKFSNLFELEKCKIALEKSEMDIQEAARLLLKDTTKKDEINSYNSISTTLIYETEAQGYDFKQNKNIKTFNVLPKSLLQPNDVGNANFSIRNNLLLKSNGLLFSLSQQDEIKVEPFETENPDIFNTIGRFFEAEKFNDFTQSVEELQSLPVSISRGTSSNVPNQKESVKKVDKMFKIRTTFITNHSSLPLFSQQPGSQLFYDSFNSLFFTVTFEQTANAHHNFNRQRISFYCDNFYENQKLSEIFNTSESFEKSVSSVLMHLSRSRNLTQFSLALLKVLQVVNNHRSEMPKRLNDWVYLLNIEQKNHCQNRGKKSKSNFNAKIKKMIDLSMKKQFENNVLHKSVVKKNKISSFRELFYVYFLCEKGNFKTSKMLFEMYFENQGNQTIEQFALVFLKIGILYFETSYSIDSVTSFCQYLLGQCRNRSLTDSMVLSVVAKFVFVFAQHKETFNGFMNYCVLENVTLLHHVLRELFENDCVLQNKFVNKTSVILSCNKSLEVDDGNDKIIDYSIFRLVRKRLAKYFHDGKEFTKAFNEIANLTPNDQNDQVILLRSIESICLTTYGYYAIKFESSDFKKKYPDCNFEKLKQHMITFLIDFQSKVSIKQSINKTIEKETTKPTLGLESFLSFLVVSTKTKDIRFAELIVMNLSKIVERKIQAKKEIFKLNETTKDLMFLNQNEGVNQSEIYVLETSHPIERGKNIIFKRIHNIDALGFVIEFDKKSQNEESSDSLIFNSWFEPEKKTNINQTGEGKVNKFVNVSARRNLKKNIIMIGNNLDVQFISSNVAKNNGRSLNQWGYKLYVKPIIGDCNQWMFSDSKAMNAADKIQHLEDYSIIKCMLFSIRFFIEHLIKGTTITKEERQLSQYLNWSILQKGLSTLDCKSFIVMNSEKQYLLNQALTSRQKSFVLNSLDSEKLSNTSKTINDKLSFINEDLDLQELLRNSRDKSTQVSALIDHVKSLELIPFIYSSERRKVSFEKNIQNSWDELETMIILCYLHHSNILELLRTNKNIDIEMVTSQANIKTELSKISKKRYEIINYMLGECKTEEHYQTNFIDIFDLLKDEYSKKYIETKRAKIPNNVIEQQIEKPKEKIDKKEHAKRKFLENQKKKTGKNMNSKKPIGGKTSEPESITASLSKMEPENFDYFVMKEIDELVNTHDFIVKAKKIVHDHYEGKLEDLKKVFKRKEMEFTNEPKENIKILTEFALGIIKSELKKGKNEDKCEMTLKLDNFYYLVGEEMRERIVFLLKLNSQVYSNSENDLGDALLPEFTRVSSKKDTPVKQTTIDGDNDLTPILYNRALTSESRKFKTKNESEDNGIRNWVEYYKTWKDQTLYKEDDLTSAVCSPIYAVTKFLTISQRIKIEVFQSIIFSASKRISLRIVSFQHYQKFIELVKNTYFERFANQFLTGMFPTLSVFENIQTTSRTFKNALSELSFSAARGMIDDFLSIVYLIKSAVPSDIYSLKRLIESDGNSSSFFFEEIQLRIDFLCNLLSEIYTLINNSSFFYFVLNSLSNEMKMKDKKIKLLEKFVNGLVEFLLFCRSLKSLSYDFKSPIGLIKKTIKISTVLTNYLIKTFSSSFILVEMVGELLRVELGEKSQLNNLNLNILRRLSDNIGEQRFMFLLKLLYSCLRLFKNGERKTSKVSGSIAKRISNTLYVIVLHSKHSRIVKLGLLCLEFLDGEFGIFKSFTKDDIYKQMTFNEVFVDKSSVKEHQIKLKNDSKTITRFTPKTEEKTHQMSQAILDPLSNNLLNCLYAIGDLVLISSDPKSPTSSGEDAYQICLHMTNEEDLCPLIRVLFYWESLYPSFTKKLPKDYAEYLELIKKQSVKTEPLDNIVRKPAKINDVNLQFYQQMTNKMKMCENVIQDLPDFDALKGNLPIGWFLNSSHIFSDQKFKKTHKKDTNHKTGRKIWENKNFNKVIFALTDCLKNLKPPVFVNEDKTISKTTEELPLIRSSTLGSIDLNILFEGQYDKELTPASITKLIAKTISKKPLDNNNDTTEKQKNIETNENKKKEDLKQNSENPKTEELKIEQESVNDKVENGQIKEKQIKEEAIKNEQDNQPKNDQEKQNNEIGKVNQLIEQNKPVEKVNEEHVEQVIDKKIDQSKAQKHEQSKIDKTKMSGIKVFPPLQELTEDQIIQKIVASQVILEKLQLLEKSEKLNVDKFTDNETSRHPIAKDTKPFLFKVAMEESKVINEQIQDEKSKPDTIDNLKEYVSDVLKQISDEKVDEKQNDFKIEEKREKQNEPMNDQKDDKQIVEQINGKNNEVPNPQNSEVKKIEENEKPKEQLQEQPNVEDDKNESKNLKDLPDLSKSKTLKFEPSQNPFYQDSQINLEKPKTEVSCKVLDSRPFFTQKTVELEDTITQYMVAYELLLIKRGSPAEKIEERREFMLKKIKTAKLTYLNPDQKTEPKTSGKVYRNLKPEEQDVIREEFVQAYRLLLTLIEICKSVQMIANDLNSTGFSFIYLQGVLYCDKLEKVEELAYLINMLLHKKMKEVPIKCVGDDAIVKKLAPVMKFINDNNFTLEISSSIVRSSFIDNMNFFYNYAGKLKIPQEDYVKFANKYLIVSENSPTSKSKSLIVNMLSEFVNKVIGKDKKSKEFVSRLFQKFFESEAILKESEQDAKVKIGLMLLTTEWTHELISSQSVYSNICEQPFKIIAPPSVTGKSQIFTINEAEPKGLIKVDSPATLLPKMSNFDLAIFNFEHSIIINKLIDLLKKHNCSQNESKSYSRKEIDTRTTQQLLFFATFKLFLRLLENDTKVSNEELNKLLYIKDPKSIGNLVNLKKEFFNSIERVADSSFSSPVLVLEHYKAKEERYPFELERRKISINIEEILNSRTCEINSLAYNPPKSTLLSGIDLKNEKISEFKMLKFWEKNIIPKILNFVKGSLAQYEIEDFFEQIRIELRKENNPGASNIAYILCDQKLPNDCVLPSLNYDWNCLDIDEIKIGQFVSFKIKDDKYLYSHVLERFNNLGVTHLVGVVIFKDPSNNCVNLLVRDFYQSNLFSFWIPQQSIKLIEHSLKAIPEFFPLENLADKVEDNFNELVYSMKTEFFIKGLFKDEYQLSLEADYGTISLVIMRELQGSCLSSWLQSPDPTCSNASNPILCAFNSKLKETNMTEILRFIELDVSKMLAFLSMNNYSFNMTSKLDHTFQTKDKASLSAYKTANLNIFDQKEMISGMVIEFKSTSTLFRCSGVKFYDDPEGINLVEHIHASQKSDLKTLHPIVFNQPEIYYNFYFNSEALPTYMKSQTNTKLDCTIFAIPKMFNSTLWMIDLLSTKAVLFKDTALLASILKIVTNLFTKFKGSSLIRQQFFKLMTRIIIKVRTCLMSSVLPKTKKSEIAETILSNPIDLKSLVKSFEFYSVECTLGLYSSFVQDLTEFLTLYSSLGPLIQSIDKSFKTRTDSFKIENKIIKEVKSLFCIADFLANIGTPNQEETNKNEVHEILKDNLSATVYFDNLITINNIPELNYKTVETIIQETIEKEKMRILVPSIDVYIPRNQEDNSVGYAVVLYDSWEFKDEIVKENKPEEKPIEPTTPAVRLWSCEICTLLNEDIATNCSVCETPKPANPFYPNEEEKHEEKEKESNENETANLWSNREKYRKFQDSLLTAFERVTPDKRISVKRHDKTNLTEIEGNVEILEFMMNRMISEQFQEKIDETCQQISKNYQDVIKSQFDVETADDLKNTLLGYEPLMLFRELARFGYDLWLEKSCLDEYGVDNLQTVEQKDIDKVIGFVVEDLCDDSDYAIHFKGTDLRLEFKTPMRSLDIYEKDSVNLLTFKDSRLFYFKYLKLNNYSNFNFRLTISAIHVFNSLLFKHYKLLDLNNTNTVSVSSNSDYLSLGLLISNIRNYWLSPIKQMISEELMNLTAFVRDHTPKVLIERLTKEKEIIIEKKSENKKPPRKDQDDRNFVLIQAFKQLAEISPSLLRPHKPKGTDPFISFEIVFKGEHVMGEGGPYRQFFTDISNELQPVFTSLHEQYEQKKLHLFIPSPNRINEIGDFREKFMINPSKRSSYSLQLYEFIGLLMGCAFRTKVFLSLNLPTLFWKKMVGQSVSEDDLEEIDIGLIQMVKYCRTCNSEDLEDNMFLYFTVLMSDTSTVELIPDGKNVRVTFENKDF